MRAWYAACSCCLIARRGSSRIFAAVSRRVLAYCVAMKFLWAAPIYVPCQDGQHDDIVLVRTFSFSSAVRILSTRFLPSR